MMFFVADNDARDLATLQGLLKSAYPEADIWPPECKAISSWATVTEELQTNTRDDKNLMVILDLGLEAQHRTSVDTGVQQARLLKSLRPRALFLAYTDYPDHAITRSYYEETFDGLIEKQRLGGYSSREGQATYIRQIIAGVMRRSGGSKPSYSLVDSVGLRLAAAAFGQQVFDVLVEEVAHDWGGVQIASLTSGHSGAFLLTISGTHESGVQRLIVKCARDKRLIESETHRVQTYLSELGPLAEVLAPVSRLHALPQDLGYYYCQPKIPGEPLLDMLRNRPWDAGATAILDGILSMEERCYDRSASEPFGQIRPSEIFVLSPLDLGRANQSLRFLGDVGSCVEETKQWPCGVPSALGISAKMSLVLSGWESLLDAENGLLSVDQHGELNPGNVMVPTPGKVVLIDCSRLGRWPVGYDIARLALLLRMRLTDHDRHRDWAENRLKVWANEKVCSLEVEQDPDSSVCPWAMYCEQQFRAFLQKRQPSERQKIARGYRLGTLWDLIKVLSYSDLSPFKRLWALIECWRLCVSLNFVE